MSSPEQSNPSQEEAENIPSESSGLDREADYHISNLIYERQKQEELGRSVSMLKFNQDIAQQDASRIYHHFDDYRRIYGNRSEISNELKAEIDNILALSAELYRKIDNFKSVAQVESDRLKCYETNATMELENTRYQEVHDQSELTEDVTRDE